MKKVLVMLLMGALMAPMTLSAQDDLARPKNSGVKEFDEFKNNAFNIYEGSVKFRAKVEGEEELAPEDLEAMDKLRMELKKLDDTSQEMVSKAGKLKSLKAPKAVKNTKTSVKALAMAKENFQFIDDSSED